MNSIHLFLIIFIGHHRWSPGWAMSSEIRWDCYADFDWKQWEKCFGHFMACDWSKETQTEEGCILEQMKSGS